MIEILLAILQLLAIGYVWWVVKTHQHDPIRVEMPTTTVEKPTLSADNDAALRQIARALARKIIEEARAQRDTLPVVVPTIVETPVVETIQRVQSPINYTPSVSHHGIIAEHLEALRERRQRRREARQ